MKTNSKQSAMIIAGMVYESGLLSEPVREDPVPLIEVKAPTNTPESAEGWWDEKPTPVILE